MGDKTVLFTRPAHDDVTYYLYLYSKELVKFAKSKGFKSLNEEKKNANKIRITSLIQKEKPRFIMFNGHGGPKCICGHRDEILIEQGINHYLLKSKTVYSLSCSSALELGKKSVDDGTIAFIGYSNDFALGMDTNCQSSPYRDKRARLFLDPSNILVKSLLKGNTIEESVIRSKEQIKKNISLLRTDSSPDAITYAPYLYHNYISLTAHGNTSESLV